MKRYVLDTSNSLRCFKQTYALCISQLLLLLLFFSLLYFGFSQHSSFSVYIFLLFCLFFFSKIFAHTYTNTHILMLYAFYRVLRCSEVAATNMYLTAVAKVWEILSIRLDKALKSLINTLMNMRILIYLWEIIQFLFVVIIVKNLPENWIFSIQLKTLSFHQQWNNNSSDHYQIRRFKDDKIFALFIFETMHIIDRISLLENKFMFCLSSSFPYFVENTKRSKTKSSTKIVFIIDDN